MTRLKSKPALLVIDMQNGFCHTSGSFGRMGIPTTRQASVIPTIARLTSICHDRGVPVIYTQVAFNADYSDAGIAESEFTGLKEAKGFIRDTWDVEIVEGLQPRPDDLVIQKTRNNIFYGTELENLLRDRGIDQVLATGVATNVCVESSVREARTHGFHALTVSDGTATLSDEEQQASMLNLKRFGGIISARELEEELKAWG